MPARGSQPAPCLSSAERDALKKTRPGGIAGALQAEYGKLRSLARRWRPHGDGGEDAVQDVCVKALLSEGSLRDPDKAYPWLKTTLFNVIVDCHRRDEARLRAEKLFVEVRMAEVMEPSRFALCGCLEAAIPKIRPSYANLLLRVDLAGEPRAEVAASLGITPNNLRVQVLRARRALRRHVAEACADCPAYDGSPCTCSRGTGS